MVSIIFRESMLTAWRVETGPRLVSIVTLTRSESSTSSATELSLVLYYARIMTYLRAVNSMGHRRTRSEHTVVLSLGLYSIQGKGLLSFTHPISMFEVACILCPHWYLFRTYIPGGAK